MTAAWHLLAPPLLAGPSGESGPRTWMRILDYGIISSLLVVPLSVFIFYQLGPFPSLFFQQACFFTLPALLLAFKLTSHRGGRRRGLKVTGWYFAFVGYGLAAAFLFGPRAEWGQVKHYVYLLYWMSLVSVFLATSRQPAAYYLNRMRLLFVHIGYAALLFLAVHALTPFRPPVVPMVGSQYASSFLNVTYSFLPWFGGRVPRFSFLYIEPRIAGNMMILGLFLQCGWIGALRRAGRPTHKACWNLAVILFSFLVIYSYLALLELAVAAVCIGLTALFRREAVVWAVLLAGCLAGSLALAVWVNFGSSPIALGSLRQELTGVSLQLGSVLEEKTGKEATAGNFDEHFRVRLDGMVNLAADPLGRGIRYFNASAGEAPAEPGSSNNSFGNLYIHAGVLGLAGAVWLVRRLLSMLRQSARAPDPMLVWGCRMALFAILFSTVADSVSLSMWFYFLLFLLELGRQDLQRRGRVVFYPSNPEMWSGGSRARA
ncbi:MAG TPA: hypothetical protein VEU62_12360 [Bryobacterales bacterium]|nr:hypothetical protein [Bryobacterales bacterium]